MGWLSICSVFLQYNSNLLNFEVREPGAAVVEWLLVKLFACGARGPGFDSRSRHSKIGYLLLPNHNMAEIPQARR